MRRPGRGGKIFVAATLLAGCSGSGESGEGRAESSTPHQSETTPIVSSCPKPAAINGAEWAGVQKYLGVNVILATCDLRPPGYMVWVLRHSVGTDSRYYATRGNNDPAIAPGVAPDIRNENGTYDYIYGLPEGQPEGAVVLVGGGRECELQLRGVEPGGLKDIPAICDRLGERAVVALINNQG